MRRPVLTRAMASLVLAAFLVAPVRGEDPPPTSPDDGLTRETFTDPNTPAHPPEPKHTSGRARTRRTHLDSKDFLSVHHAHRHERAARKTATVASAASPSHPSRRRNPVVRFVYWWNGWVIRTFHTKVGTVMLGTIGAQS